MINCANIFPFCTGTGLELIGGVWSLDGKESLLHNCQVSFAGKVLIGKNVLYLVQPLYDLNYN